MTPGDRDPTSGRSGDDRDGQPIVGRSARGWNPLVIAGVFAVLAVVLFLILNTRRGDQTASLVTPSGTDNSTGAAAPPPPLDISPRPPVATPAPIPVAAPPPLPMPPPLQAVVSDEVQRLHAPAVVVDLQSANGPGVSILAAGPAGAPPGSSAAAKADAGSPLKAIAAAGEAGSALLSGAAPSAGLGANEQFAARVSNGSPEPAVATQLTGLGTTITQGATIPGILETAVNSDLPGYTRAVVSRDVRSFDGKSVLIPRGSRLIGQYRSALSLGQSRVFVIWTRVIRPDGVSIQIGSPGDDALGRGGLSGDVNTHFFARFGSSILLSILNGGIAAIAGTPTTQISIGSPAAAAGAAAAATVPTGSDIMPTITVKQGVPINIFVARDLDFSNVKFFQ
jgi:type IV secretory pathway VirB10-like protein